MLSTHDGRWLPVEDVLDTGEYETVYNMRVADHHTYFVGMEAWGFGVWAHNTCERTGSGKNEPHGRTAGTKLKNQLAESQAQLEVLQTAAQRRKLLPDYR